MEQGFHGSLERTPGALVRAMGALLLLKTPGRSRESLARELQEHLRTLGVEYHVRTLKRQLTGSVSSVPPEVQAAMRDVLLRVDGLRTDRDIEIALGAAGLWVSPEERQPEYLSTERIVPLAQLWLLFNPTHTRHSLAALLRGRLAHRGVRAGAILMLGGQDESQAPLCELRLRERSRRRRMHGMRLADRERQRYRGD